MLLSLPDISQVICLVWPLRHCFKAVQSPVTHCHIETRHFSNIIRLVGLNIFKVPSSGMFRMILAVEIFCCGCHSNRVCLHLSW
jgi:hypothetical protein